MRISRRTALKGAATLPLAAANFDLAALAQPAPAAPGASEIPPILFAHGNGEQAPLWMTTMWRMESNGVARERMFAINFTDPLARTDDTKPEPNHRRPAPRTRRGVLTEAGSAITHFYRSPFPRSSDVVHLRAA